MAYYEDLGTTTQIASGSFVRAIGWLAAGHAFPRGEGPPGFRERLRAFSQAWGESILALGWGAFMGCHTCEFCRDLSTSGNFGVPANSIIYVCPEMISHYVEAHGYLPPTDFIGAVLSSALPGSDEYARAVHPFLSSGIANRLTRG